jgi:uncharacterized protein (DUF3084 family)
MELRSQLETERADQEEMRQNSRLLKQNSVPAATLFEKLTPDLGNLKATLQILES